MLMKYELPLTLKITFVQNCAIPKLYFHLQTLPVVIAEGDFLSCHLYCSWNCNQGPANRLPVNRVYFDVSRKSTFGVSIPLQQ